MDPRKNQAPDAGESEFRAECYRCFRAQSVCICDQVPTVCNRTGVIVLQHHRELLHPIGTARIARLGLEKNDIRICRRALKLIVKSKVPDRTALLYPHPSARNLEELDASELPNNLIVLDGTWTQASAMYKANDWLAEIPHLVIQPKQQSNYRIRRQPKPGCLSTIEALVYALNFLEPETGGFDELLDVFDSMVDQQLKHIG